MKPERVGVAGLVVAGLLAGLAVFAGPNEAAAAPAAGGALVALAAAIALLLFPSVRWHAADVAVPVADPLVSLRHAFREGALGRQRIAQAVLELERGSLGRGAASDGDPIALHPEAATPEEFRRWVEERLRRIEAAT